MEATMMDIEEVGSTEQAAPSEERLLDAQAIEEAAAQMTRVSARLHLESLAKKLRKESEALKRVEKSRAMAEKSEAAATMESAGGGNEASSIPAKDDESKSSQEPSAVAATPPAPTPRAPKVVAAKPPPLTNQAKYIPIDKFAFDFGGYRSKFVTIYIDLPFVGTIPKEQITCDFHTSSFDLIVKNLEGKSYRLVKTNLEKDIVPDKSKYIVKSDKIVIKLAKVKGEYGSFDYWSKLTNEKKGVTGSKKSDDPSAGLMDMMKDMYDSGDDNMKKMIGETMMKQRRGELGADSALGGL